MPTLEEIYYEDAKKFWPTQPIQLDPTPTWQYYPLRTLTYLKDHIIETDPSAQMPAPILYNYDDSHDFWTYEQSLAAMNTLVPKHLRKEYEEAQPVYTRIPKKIFESIVKAAQKDDYVEEFYCNEMMKFDEEIAELERQGLIAFPQDYE